jgi:hypothetical protein
MSKSAKNKDDLYDVSSKIVKDRMAAENVEDLSVINNLDANAVVVVFGSADKIQNVLTAINLPHTLIQPDQLHLVKLNPEQTLYINCHPNGYDAAAYEKVRQFINDGGQVISTDYTLNTLLQYVFPNTLRYDGANSQDETIGIVINNDEKDDEVLKGFKNEETWRLAGGSHPITILDEINVKVLISSPQLAKFNASNAILIRFEYGKGVVYHMISHFELQHANKTTKAQLNSTPQSLAQPGQGQAMPSKSVQEYAKSKGASIETVQKLEALEAKQKSDLDDNYMNCDDVQNATTQSEFVYRAVVSKQKKNKSMFK